MCVCVCVCVSDHCVRIQSRRNPCLTVVNGIRVCARALYILLLYYNKRLKETSQWVVVQSSTAARGVPGGRGNKAGAEDALFTFWRVNYIVSPQSRSENCTT